MTSTLAAFALVPAPSTWLGVSVGMNTGARHAELRDQLVMESGLAIQICLRVTLHSSTLTIGSQK